MKNRKSLAVSMIALFGVGVALAVLSLRVPEPLLNPLQDASILAFIGSVVLNGRSGCP